MVAYALPSSVALVSAIGHGAEHLSDVARDQRRQAAALGLAHTASPAQTSSAQTSPVPPVSTADRSESAGWVHTHGGSTHRHDGLVGRLVQASPLDGAELHYEVAPATLTVHLPATRSGNPLRPTLCATGVLGSGMSCGASGREPRVPPPRV